MKDSCVNRPYEQNTQIDGFEFDSFEFADFRPIYSRYRLFSAPLGNRQ